MRPTRSTTCVDGDANRAVRGILEPSRHRQRRCKFTMNLRLSRPRSDRAPGYEVSRVLRTNGVQELAAGGQPHFCDIQKKGTRYAETLVDLEATIHFWVVDETLPTHGGTRLLEVDTHDDMEVLLCLFCVVPKQACVLQRGLDIVDRAWTAWV